MSSSSFFCWHTVLLPTMRTVWPVNGRAATASLVAAFHQPRSDLHSLGRRIERKGLVKLKHLALIIIGATPSRGDPSPACGRSSSRQQGRANQVATPGLPVQSDCMRVFDEGRSKTRAAQLESRFSKPAGSDSGTRALWRQPPAHARFCNPEKAAPFPPYSSGGEECGHVVRGRKNRCYHRHLRTSRRECRSPRRLWRIA